MTKTSEDPDGSQRHIQIIVRRRGAGIILAIFTILFLMGTGAAQRAQAQVEGVIHSFGATSNDGVNPEAGLLMGPNGNLYSTTYGGGAHGAGTVFELTQASAYTGEAVLYSFGSVANDGANPAAGLIMDPSGNLYGTTSLGGSNSEGTVFELAKSSSGYSSTDSVLVSFYSAVGIFPVAGLIRDSSGNLYGTTNLSAAYGPCNTYFVGGGEGCGSVFELSPPAPGDSSWNLQVLLDFDGTYGAQPFGGLVMDSSGNLYGTTSEFEYSGQGNVFELSPPAPGATTWTPQVLYNFTGYNSNDPSASDGGLPEAGLIMDSAGNFYGTTTEGGSSTACGVVGCGTVFELSPDSSLPSGYKETVLYSFGSVTNDGADPVASLLMGPSGNLYGTTRGGGADDDGTVFELTQASGYKTETVLFSFDGSDGSDPVAGLIADSSGNLYGTTEYGGAKGDGTAFELAMAPQSETALMVSQINALYTAGALNSGQDSSLVKKLQQAINLINAGEISGAIGSLEGFINEVTALENSNVLTSDQAAALITSATDVIAQLQ